MIMAIDVSNTNITLGTFNGAKLLKIYRVTTKVPRTSDEYGVLLRDLVRLSNASHHDIEGIIIASVVPNVMYSLTNACIKYFHVHPIIVGPGVKTGVSFCTSPFSMLSSVPSLKLNFVITVCSDVDGVDGTAFSGIAILIVYSIFFPLDIAIVCVMIFICLFKSTGI